MTLGVYVYVKDRVHQGISAYKYPVLAAVVNIDGEGYDVAYESSPGAYSSIWVSSENVIFLSELEQILVCGSIPWEKVL